MVMWCSAMKILVRYRELTIYSRKEENTNVANVYSVIYSVASFLG
jgi:hypothetical protein